MAKKEIIISEVSDYHPFSPETFFNTIKPLIYQGIIQGVEIAPNRFSSIEHYQQLSSDYGVPIKGVHGVLFGDARNVVDHLKQSKTPHVALEVGLIALAMGTQSEPPLLKRYGTTLRIASEVQAKYIVQHEENIAFLKRIKQLPTWTNTIQNLRKNGWGPEDGRPNPLSWNIYAIAEDAHQGNYGTILATDTALRTGPTLPEGYMYDLLRANEILKPSGLHFADYDNATKQEKIVPQIGKLHHSELAELLREFNGDFITIEVKPEKNSTPYAAISDTINYISAQLSI